MKRVALLCMVPLAVTAFPVDAGVEFVDASGDVTVVSDGRVASRSRDDGTIHVMNARKGRITVIYPERERYARASVQAYCQALEDLQTQAMARLSEEERRMMEQFMEMARGDSGGAAGSTPEVTVRHGGTGGKVAGYNTEHYSVYVDGDLYEELWITGDKKLLSEFGDYQALVELGEKLSACVTGAVGVHTRTEPERSEPYKELMRKGWELKTVGHAAGQAESEQIRQIRIRDIPDSRFEAPSAYREISMGEMIQMQQDLER